MNERLKQLHNLNRAMQNANDVEIRKSMKVAGLDPYNEHLNKTRGDKT
jgi:hypothetical protein